MAYLNSRKLQMRVNGDFLNEYEAMSEVNIIINDFGLSCKSEYQSYAEELKIYNKINSELDVANLLDFK